MLSRAKAMNHLEKIDLPASILYNSLITIELQGHNLRVPGRTILMKGHSSAETQYYKYKKFWRIELPSTPGQAADFSSCIAHCCLRKHNCCNQ